MINFTRIGRGIDLERLHYGFFRPGSAAFLLGNGSWPWRKGRTSPLAAQPSECLIFPRSAARLCSSSSFSGYSCSLPKICASSLICSPLRGSGALIVLFLQYLPSYRPEIILWRCIHPQKATPKPADCYGIYGLRRVSSASSGDHGCVWPGPRIPTRANLFVFMHQRWSIIHRFSGAATTRRLRILILPAYFADKP